MGWGDWTGPLPDGGYLGVFLSNSGSAQQTFEVGVSDSGEFALSVIANWDQMYSTSCLIRLRIPLKFPVSLRPVYDYLHERGLTVRECRTDALK